MLASTRIKKIPDVNAQTTMTVVACSKRNTRDTDNRKQKQEEVVIKK